MALEEAIINPVKTRNAPELGPTALLAATKLDLHAARRRLGINREDFRRIYLSRLYQEANQGQGFALAGPVTGAPYAVMVLETLVAWGARHIVFLGWCGAISKRLKIGDLILASGAIIGEGTSPYYRDPAEPASVAQPSATLVNKIRHWLSDLQWPHHEGVVWSTDALYRETRQQVRKLYRQGVLAVEMELSALFSVGRFRGVQVAGVLVVSDLLSSLEWQPGFKSEQFKKGRGLAIEGTLDICRNL